MIGTLALFLINFGLVWSIAARELLLLLNSFPKFVPNSNSDTSEADSFFNIFSYVSGLLIKIVFADTSLLRLSYISETRESIPGNTGNFSP